MVKGILGIIYCPMLEDELLHSLRNDKEIDRIVLLENSYCQSLRKKMTDLGIPFDYIPEEGFDQGRAEFDREKFNVVIKANDLALHAEPAKLKEYIEGQVRAIQPYVDVLGLYYGMCGNFGWDMTEWCKEQGLKPAFMFRGEDGLVADDCVAVAIGGSSKYRDFVHRYTGMFFMTPAIVHNWQAFVGAGDLGKSMANIPKETLAEFGIFNDTDYMRWLFEVGHYEHSLEIDTGLSDSQEFLKQCEEVSGLLNLKPIKIEDGWVSLYCADSIYDHCKKAMS